MRLLIEFGGVSPQTRDSNTNHVPLHEAAILGHSEIISVLLLCRAPLRPRTRDNETPLDLARKFGHENCCEMLGKMIYYWGLAKITKFRIELKSCFFIIAIEMKKKND